ncbi:uncharacterized protein LOC143839816 [Paroedura picta]|uniref:uncharacterized protein LOC143839816 n=1 Tax=Paroedura picta TaxID=143630 RepID=UPI004057BDD1
MGIIPTQILGAVVQVHHDGGVGVDGRAIPRVSPGLGPRMHLAQEVAASGLLHKRCCSLEASGSLWAGKLSSPQGSGQWGGKSQEWSMAPSSGQDGMRLLAP